MTPRYGPPDAKRAPRYTGVRTFARCPHVRDVSVHVAIVGVPFDTGTSFRVGARFGPEAVRSASTLLRPTTKTCALTSSRPSRWRTGETST